MRRAFSKLIQTLLVVVLALAFSPSVTAGELASLLEKRLATLSKERAAEITSSIESMEGEQQQGMIFLYAYMPERDIYSISTNYVEKNVEYAYKARNQFSWAKEIPMELFLNDVLPYASMDETRDEWREDFYNMLLPLVKDAGSLAEAVDIINRSLKELVKVEYNTKRNRPNQAPSESMELGMASCSGLSILLTDAFRAVGIPSRIGGTPLWVTLEGNHNWSEVWVDGRWYFTEYYFDALDHGWFLDRCAKFKGNTKPEHQVYVTSYAPSEDGQHFPMVWSREDLTVPGIIVTDRYVEIYENQQAEAAAISENQVEVVVKVLKKGGKETISADRVAVAIEITDADNQSVATGESRGANADMNDYFKARVTKEGKYTIKYGDKSHKFNSTSEDQTIILHL